MKSFRRASSTNPITVKPWYDDEHFYDADFSIIVALHDAATPKVITQDDFRTGLIKMAEKYPRLFQEIVDESGDANTGRRLPPVRVVR